MTEETHPDDDSYIVRVKAVVMTRDDSSGGWLALEGGGLSRVGVCKVLPSELMGRSDFLILGERLKDKQVILEFFLKKDLIYTKATPTFHHWKVDNRKCGLTFQSPADARAFDRGVRKAVADLTEGSTTSSSTIQNEAELGDDDVFTKKEHFTQALSSPAFYEPRLPPCTHHHHQHRGLERCFPEQDEDEEIVRINPRERAWLTGYEDYRHAGDRGRFFRANDGDSYVHFAKSEPSKHDYNYPYVPDRDFCLHDHKGRVMGRGVGVVSTQPHPLQVKRNGQKEGERSRCVYCRDMFNHEENGRGHCQDAPDPIRTCIHRVSFMWCADSLLYHCLSDPEGDYSDPCSCDVGDERFCLRWLALLALSLVAPCMCCYMPLRVCHRCGVACHCCGGKHKAAG
ncbi:sprouty-related, EVH1 domain-containing protein 2-like isoform X5 [Brienomyrus brachyistius]|uniref:sprouty-related, EVH1 domain-containing protein 2-like isoform X5 n=1 Tax=Brienomyrus brachyistius TaxID=42636 RepID=UPI0020B42A0F|nr:sprouty-related, EVH1 domain-containing protein 2-like isoform X5 [Brienomyrus brachyistius]